MAKLISTVRSRNSSYNWKTGCSDWKRPAGVFEFAGNIGRFHFACTKLSESCMYWNCILALI